MSLLFVYGSLRSEAMHPMHRLVAHGGALRGRATMRGRLLVVDWYPGLVDGEGSVVGELWQLASDDRFAKLDEYEDVEFKRALRDARLDGGATQRAWVYLYTGPSEGLKVVPGGDWLLGGKL